MPRDMNGRSIQVGDFVVVQPINHKPKVVARVATLDEQGNATVLWPALAGFLQRDYAASRSMQVLLRHDGSEPGEVLREVAPPAAPAAEASLEVVDDHSTGPADPTPAAAEGSTTEPAAGAEAAEIPAAPSTDPSGI